MPRIREPAGEELVAHPVGDMRPEDHRAERDVARVDPLRHRDDVRDDVPVLAREPAAGPAEARHHLVEDEQDPVAVAHLADRLEVAVRRRDDAVRPGHGLQEHRGDGLRPLVLEDLLEVRRARADRARIGMPGGAAVRVRVEHADDAGHPGLVRPPPRVAGQRDSAERGPVVRAITRDDLVPPRVQPRELDRVLVRLGTRVREERHREIARRDLREQAARVATATRSPSAARSCRACPPAP